MSRELVALLSQQTGGGLGALPSLIAWPGLLVAESVEPREGVQAGEVERDLFVNSLTEINLYILSFLLWGKRVRSESPHVRHQGMPER